MSAEYSLNAAFDVFGQMIDPSKASSDVDILIAGEAVSTEQIEKLDVAVILNLCRIGVKQAVE
jgi:hypothetical protein